MWLTGDFFGIIKKYYKKINYIDNKHVIIVHNNEYKLYKEIYVYFLKKKKLCEEQLNNQ